MRTLCARWVPRLFTIEQKQRREDASIEFLLMYHSNKADFLHRFITMNEKWMHLSLIIYLQKGKTINRESFGQKESVVS